LNQDQVEEAPPEGSNKHAASGADPAKYPDARFEAFYELCSTLNRVTDLNEVYEAALDAIQKSFGAHRGSVLLFDPDEVLRFKASRNLSENYRRKVEGHSPWSRKTLRPEPIAITSVAKEMTGDLAKTILEEGIQSLAFFPLCGSEQLLGKFMVYFDRPHEFTPVEIQDAETIAGHVAYAIERQIVDQARARLATIVENSDDAIVSKSLEGIITSWNESATRLFGYTAREAIGQSIRLIVPDDRWAEEQTILARLRAGERIDHFETIRRTKGGRSVHVSITVSPIRDSSGRIIGASKNARDIRDLRRSKEMLQSLVRIGSRFGSTLDTATIFQMLLEEATLMVNAMGGYSALADSDGLRTNFQIRQDTVTPFNEMWLGAEEIASSRNIGQSLLDKSLLQRSEVTDLVAVPILDSAGALLGAFQIHNKVDGTAFDDTDRDLLRTVAVSASSAIQNAMAYAQMREAEARLVAADARKNEFLATLAHELRNPLAPIQTSVNLLQLRRESLGDLEIVAGVIDRQVTQMARLIDDLMDVSRITHGRIQIQREQVDLGSVLKGALETAEPVFADHRQKLILDPIPDGITVFGDPIRLTQIFGNLLSNASKYTEAGGEIEVSIVVEADEVTIAFRDSGIGIEPKHLLKIFEMFSQETPALKRSQGGLGLGLWLVGHLVELHHGSIEARSEGLGKGSEFIVTLPLTGKGEGAVETSSAGASQEA
jgi:PAS domain S-box-containing protein